MLLHFSGTLSDECRDEAARCMEAMGQLKEAGDFRKAGPDGASGLICSGGNCSHITSAARPLKNCARCRAVWYCNPACQKADWARHKKYCKKLDT